MTGRFRSVSLSLGALLLVFILGGQAWGQAQRDCSDFSTQEEAQEHYDSRSDDDPNDPDPDDLDTDGDGKACEGLPTAAQATADPAATAAPNEEENELPQNGAETGVIALSGLSLLEAGYGLTLASKRLGIRRRAIPLYLMRRMITAAERGQDRVELSDDVYLVHRSVLDNAPLLEDVEPVLDVSEDEQDVDYEYLDLDEIQQSPNGHAPAPAGPTVYAALAKRARSVDN